MGHPAIKNWLPGVWCGAAGLFAFTSYGHFVPIEFFFHEVEGVVAYLVVGNSFRPVEQLMNEVEAITDGRSLHRRLPADSSNDELSRLSLTVNAMLARLETSFAALRRFTADASHELKTPLTVLRADVERAMHPSTNRAERMVALEEALQETARMSDLVDSLLTLARADEAAPPRVAGPPGLRWRSPGRPSPARGRSAARVRPPRRRRGPPRRGRTRAPGRGRPR